MTQEQITKLHELEEERRYLIKTQLSEEKLKRITSANICDMRLGDVKLFIIQELDNVSEQLMRKIANSIQAHYVNYIAYRQRRLDEIEKEIAEL